MILRLLCLVLAAAVLSGPVRAQDAAAPAAGEEAPKKAPKTKKKDAAKKKTEKEPKYKSKSLAEGEEHHYRFDPSGNPVEKKKSSSAKDKKKKKNSSDEESGAKPACSADDSCPSGRSPDADAL